VPQFHIVEEMPTNSGIFEETTPAEVIADDVEKAKLRCIDLSQDGNRYGVWVESP
jgi:hypothetical protein